jgi:glycosyltransferase involved in cell wall biosynthesis
MKIAVASSGLGHVSRGIETWALDLARALAARGMDATLFCAGDIPAAEPPAAAVVVLHARRRNEPATQRRVARAPGFTWRWGFKSPYGWEQASFWWRLWPHLRRGHFDILHVQDPMLAWWCRVFRRAGLVRTLEILAHGTEESPAFLRKFPRAQHLAPWHVEQAEGGGMKDERTPCQPASEAKPLLSPSASPGAEPLPAPAPCRSRGGGSGRHWVVIPNFVDTARFRPCADAAEKTAARQVVGVPSDAFAIGCVAAVKKTHKRVDYLIREFAGLVRGSGVRVQGSAGGVFLLVVGARTEESGELERLAGEQAPGRIRFLYDQPRAAMVELYRAMDLLVLPSLFEMMPIALLEAMASGVPVVVNRHPVLEWICGETAPGQAGGVAIEMGRDGALSGFLAGVSAEWLRERGVAARARADAVFSTDVVVRQYVEFYRRVLGE